jgi:hypothetical protein
MIEVSGYSRGDEEPSMGSDERTQLYGVKMHLFVKFYFTSIATVK